MEMHVQFWIDVRAKERCAIYEPWLLIVNTRGNVVVDSYRISDQLKKCCSVNVCRTHSSLIAFAKCGEGDDTGHALGRGSIIVPETGLEDLQGRFQDQRYT